MQNNPLARASWHQGIASIITILRRNGHRADLLEIEYLDFDRIEEEVRVYDPDVIAATSNSNDFVYVRDIFKYLKKRMPHIYTVLGGVHITANPGDIFKLQKIVDAVCLGEGEGPMLDLIAAIDQGRIPAEIDNMFYPDGGIGTVKQSYYVKDLDLLPIADRNIFKAYRNAANIGQLPVTVRFLWCRGCPFNCSYCCNKVLKEFYPSRQNYVRRPSVGKAVDELCLVSDQYKFDHFVIDDDIFTLDKDWVREFCRRYPGNLIGNKKFTVNVRVGTVDREMLSALKEIGCELIEFGVESGDELIRQNVLNRKMTNEMIFETANMCREVGLHFQTFNMVGIPGEGVSEILKTIRLNQKLRPDRLQVSIFYPFPNTKLGQHCIEKGMIGEEFHSTYFGKSILKHDKLGRKTIEFYGSFFKLLVYSGYSLRKALNETISMLYKSDRLSWLKNMIPGTIKGLIIRMFR